MAHLIDKVDCINARLVYLRTPDVFKKKSDQVISAWLVCQALQEYNFAEALKLLQDEDPNQITLKRFL